MKDKILRYAKSLHNACKKYYKECGCVDCPFKVAFGCSLNGHPIEWDDKLKSVKV